jgi:hypothetical protein
MPYPWDTKRGITIAQKYSMEKKNILTASTFLTVDCLHEHSMDVFDRFLEI